MEIDEELNCSEELPPEEVTDMIERCVAVCIIFISLHSPSHF
jgi:hypothetical protein